jgi:hypothetical protein
MRKLLVLFVLAAFALAGPLAMNSFAKKETKEPPKVNCCVKGDCKEMTKDDCTKAKGKVVKDCKKECK